jgi:integrase
MPATEEVAAIFANAPAGDPLTPLLELYRGRPVSKDSIRRQWAKLKRQSGITNLVPHDLRRTVAVPTYELTKDLRIVWQILRHKDLSTTARYIEHRDPTQLREILAQLWRPKGDTVQ